MKVKLKTPVLTGYIWIILVYIPTIYSSTVSDESSSDKIELPNENREIFHPLSLKGLHEKRHKRDLECDELECRSLCPWTWVPDSEEGRDPQSIYRAKCENQTCNFNISGIGHRVRRKLQLHTECDLVYTDIQVWKNGEATWIPWPIACACSKSRTRTLMRLGDEMVLSDFGRVANAGVRAIDEIQDNSLNVQIQSDEVPLESRRPEDNWK